MSKPFDQPLLATDMPVDHDRPAPLTEEILALSEDLPLPPTFDEPAGAPSEPKKRGGPAVQNAVEAKVPKWLKLTSTSLR